MRALDAASHCIRPECSLTCSMLYYGILLMHAIKLYAPLRLLMCIVSDVVRVTDDCLGERYDGGVGTVRMLVV